MQASLVVEQSEQQRADDVGSLLVPAETRDHAIGGAGMLDLEHRALAGLIRGVFRFRDHAVKARALEALQPFGGDLAVARHRREVDRRLDVRQQPSREHARRSPCGRSMIDSPSTASRSNPTNEDGIAFDSFATRDAAGCSRNCSASKFRPPSVAITISPSITQPGGSRSSSACVQLGKISIERLQIAALDVDVVVSSETRSIETRPTWVRRAGRRWSGMESTSLASIGSMGGCIDRPTG